MPRQAQEFMNSTGKLVEVYVKMYPDLYVLKPDDVLKIIYNHTGDAEECGLHTILHPDGRLQIFLDEFDTAVVLINDQKAEPWAKVTN